jgi:coproporphyrinogen III oxidase
MFRNTFTRRAVQLLKEPMGQEHETLSRGKRTLGNLVADQTIRFGFAAGATVAAIATTFASGNRYVEVYEPKKQ